MAESISEGTLKQWLKQKGDYAEADEEIATIETDKIDVSVNAPFAGTITEHYASEEDTVTVGQDLFNIEKGGEPGGKSDKPAEESKDESKPSESEAPKEDASKDEASKEDSTPSKRKKPDEAKVEKKEDTPDRPQPQHSPEPKQPAAKSAPAPSVAKETKESAKSSSTPARIAPAPGERTERRVKMNSMRKRIAERLKQSQNTAASLTTFNEIDMSALMALRATYKDRILKDKGVKIGFMSAFAKACVHALQEFPAVNAAIEGPGSGEQMVYRDYVDMSIAVATPKGLVTPVVRNVETMSFLDVEQAIADLGKKARDGKLTLEDMAGGTFTISNGGVFGSLFGTPIINLPQSAVLGLHAVKEKPWVVKGQVVVRPIMVVALTYDHRIIDGREAVSFLVRVKELIEDPAFMLLQ